ncbi:MAG: DUF378 domain-containing protein [Clostridia bacterium]
MLTFLSYILLIIGGMNWASIGFLQYDFVAGLFGTQANIFSRLIYILVGIATVWIVVMTIKYKGKVDILNPKFKKTAEKVGDVLGEEDKD